jgi:TRAP-type C4-dicarboxylate transport system permease small subunit
MKAIASAYNRFIVGLAGAGAVLLAVVFVSGLVDVTLRELGFKPLQWYSAFTEYSLLFMTMMGSPWLVRIKGHVVVESLAIAMPPSARWVMAKFAYLLCVLLSISFVWYGADKAIATFVSGELDIRSIDMPRWALYASIVVGFGLMGIEFLRYLLGFDSYYAGKIGSSESL